MDINHNTFDMSINFVLKNNNFNNEALVEFKLFEATITSCIISFISLITHELGRCLLLLLLLI